MNADTPMLTIAILPIKSLHRAKQRLADTLDPPTRRSLVEAMFCDALVALRRVVGLERVVVVSADRGAQRIADSYGAEIVADDESGHNAAAARGVARAAELGAERVLLVPGDCPLLDPGELDGLLRRPTPVPSVLVVPDRHGTGTNALLLTPPAVLAPAFGDGSHARHLQGAATRGVTAETVELASLALDVDTAEDLAAIHERLARVRGGAARTRGLLRQLQRSHG